MSSSSPTKEIITLQIGNYSNYIGAHFFNLQEPSLNSSEDIDHGVLWRRKKLIWTPRVLVFDLKDNYCENSSTYWSRDSGTTNKETLGKIQQEVLWQGDVKCIDQRAERSNEPSTTTATTSESGSGDRVKSWVDYTRWKLGEQEDTRFSLPNFSYNSTLAVLSNYGQGLQIYSSLEDSITDAVRKYAEPCDYLQGFHISVDQDDGIGGLASGILQHIVDVYDKKTSFVFGVSRPTVAGGNETFPDFKLRMLNTALSWNSFNLYSSVFTSMGLSDDLCKPNPKPVQLPNITYNENSPYESSSVLAAALDTLTMPYRTKLPKITLNDVAGLLNAYGHKMTLIGSAFPYPVKDNSSLFDSLNQNGLSLLKSLTPGISVDAEKSISNLFVPRGFSAEQVIRRNDESRRRGRGDEDPQQGRGITNAESCLEVYSQETCRKSVNVVRSVVTPFKLSHPFPVLFDRNLLQKPKDSMTFQSSTQGGRSEGEIPTLASAHNTLCMSELLEKTIAVAEPNTTKNFIYTSTFLSQRANMEVDDYEECINNLRTLKDTYSDEQNF